MVNKKRNIAWSKEAIKELRSGRKLTQFELSKLMDLGIDSIKGYECGRLDNPTIKTLAKFGKVFNVHFHADWTKKK